MPIRWIVSVERNLTMEADHDHMFRVILNLGRNAMTGAGKREARDPARDQIRITGRRDRGVVVIEVSDTGPSVSERARTVLFQALQGSTCSGGAGLGLAIAAELVRASRRRDQTGCRALSDATVQHYDPGSGGQSRFHAVGERISA